MFALLTQLWLAVTVAFLAGLLVKWLLDLFFLRRSVFETREQLATRERQLTDARHEHTRTAESLKNRLLELDATTKAKLAAEALAAKRARDIEAASTENAAIRSQLDAERQRAAGIEEELRMAVAVAESAATEAERLRGDLNDRSLRLAEAVALEATHESALSELRAARDLHVEAHAVVLAELDAVQSRLLAQQSVNTSLEDAIQARDTSVSGLKSQLASLEAERQSVAELLASKDAEVGRLSESAVKLAATEKLHAESKADAAKLRSQLEAATKARSLAESALKKRDAELGEWERKAQEYQAAFDDAAKENARISQELNRLNGHEAACAAALKQAEAEKASHEQSLARLVSELTALKQSQASGDTATDDLRARLKRLETEAGAAAKSKASLEGELSAVSESHARLEERFAEARAAAARAEDLAEQLGTVEAELAALKARPSVASKSDADIDAVLNDLDAVTRERNELAAELAALKSGQSGDN